jgi:hypothetical protein
MGLVNQTIPGLYGGVSQQSPELRHDTQVEEMINCYPTIIGGVTKRPPTSLAYNDDTFPNDAFIYAYDRGSGNEQYVIAINNNAQYRVFDVTHNHWVNSWTTESYLTIPAGSSAKDCFSLSTVGDTTFVVNRTVTCAMDPTVDNNDDPDWEYTFYYWVKRTNGDAGDNANLRYTYYIYRNGSQQTSNINHDSTAAASALASSIGGSSAGSVVKKVTSGVTDIYSGSDSWGSQASEGFQGSIKRLADLPNDFGFKDAVVKITGDENTNFDNFYVKYDGSSYLETFKPGLQNAFNAATMPHQIQLRRQSENPDTYYLTFDTIDWTPRKVGDEESASEPSFIGRSIEDVFFYRNRLGFLAGDNVILSESGEYYNFFPTTVTDVIDSDTIDVAVDSNQAISLRYATPFNKELLIFGDKAQFVMSAGDTLTPTDVSVQQSTAFEIKDVTPVVLGPNAYFAIEKNDYSTIREYYVQPDSLSNDAANITAHCPNYIPKNVIKIVGSSKNDMLFALSSDTPDTVYVYNFYWQGEEKAQSAWHKWTFDGGTVNIFNIEVLGSNLLLMMERDGNVNLEVMALEHKQDFSGISYLDNGSEAYEARIVLTKPGFYTGRDKIDDNRGTFVLRSIKFGADYGSFYNVTSYRYGRPLGYYYDSNQGVFPPKDYITSKTHAYTSTPGVQPNYSTLPSANLLPGVTTYEMYSDHKYPVVGNSNNLAIEITNDIPSGFRINSLDIVGTYVKNARNV